MSQIAQTNRQLYQARLMLDLAWESDDSPRGRTAEEAAVTFMYRAWCSALAEVGELYGVSLRAEDGLAGLLTKLGAQRPDGWEYRTLQESLKQPGHWMAALKREAESWSRTPSARPATPAAGNLIASVADDNEDHTNHYRQWLHELQQWVDEIRSLSDYS